MTVWARLAATGLLVTGLAGCSHSQHRAAVAPPVSMVPSASPLNSPSAAALANRITSGDETALRSALAVPSGQPIDPAAVTQFAAVGPITFDLSSFQYLDPITATVVGHVAHPPPGVAAEWTFTLIFVAPDWRLVDGSPRG